MASMNISKKTEKIQKIFDVEKLLAKNTDTKSIAKYYKINKLAYSLFHNNQNLVHMGISRDGTYKKEDLLEQPNLVKKYIKKTNARKVLELATGKGANSLYLAKEFPNVQFIGLDLPEGQLPPAKKSAKKTSNFTVVQGNFHNLQHFEEKSFDLVFIIEALCYSTKKEVVAKEVNRILKGKGIFIIADGYLGKKEESLKENELLAKKLVEKGMLVNKFENYKTVKNKITKAGFTLLEEEEVSEFILPTLYRFEKLARVAFQSTLFAKILVKTLPNAFTHNAVSGYLMPNLVKKGIAKYFLSVFEKRK